MSVPNTFASATSSIPLANLDANFAYYDAAFSISGTAVTFAGNITLTTGTANGVPYLNASKVLTSGAVLTFDGTTLSSTKFAGALNGTVGATTPTTGAFTTLGATGAIKSTGANLVNEASAIKLSQESVAVSRLSAYGNDASTQGSLQIRTVSSDGTASTIPVVISSTGLAVTGTLSATGGVTLSGGTANGVAYLNGSKVLTTGSALTFDGTNLSNTRSVATAYSGTNAATWVNGITLTNNAASATGNSNLIQFAGAGNVNTVFGVTQAASSYGDFVWASYSGAFSEQMRLTAFGNLGIGTSSPGQKLTVAGTQRIQKEGAGYEAAMLSFSTLTETGAIYCIGMASGGLFSIGRSDTAVTNLTLDSSGNVGIGTSSPLAGMKLDVAGLVAVGTVVASSGVGGNIRYRDDTGTQRYAVGILGTAAETAFSIYDIVNSTERMRLDASGNLGLGVTPSAWGSNFAAIQIKGLYGGGLSTSAASNTSTNLAHNAYNDGTNWVYGATGFGSARYEIEAPTGGSTYKWFTAPSGTAGNAITFTQAMTLTAAGELLVGTTSAAAYPTQGLSIYGNNGGSSLIGMGHATGTASGNAYMTFAYNGTGIGSITQSGTTAVLYNLTSDQRLKENIQDAASASALIDAIQVRQFDWKSDGSHQRYGFVAQELVAVAPEAVHAPADPDEMMAVDYSKLVPLLVKELQSLRARVAQLESKP